MSTVVVLDRIAASCREACMIFDSEAVGRATGDPCGNG